MNRKIKIKVAIDIIMTILLIVLMGYAVTGYTLHKWLGILEFILYIIHNAFNIRWYGAIFRGRYTTLRTVQTVINLLVAIAMVCLIISGAILSDGFGIIEINGGLSFARRLHLVSAYWGFMLMSVHIGMHWSMITVMFKKALAGKPQSAILVRIIAFAIAVYGIYAFAKCGIISFMLSLTEFPFYNTSQPILFYMDCFGIMGLFVVLTYYLKEFFNNRIYR